MTFNRLFLCGLVLAGCGSALAEDEIAHWNNVLMDSVRLGVVPPPKASRAMAIMNLAMFDAVNSIGGQYHSYHYGVASNPTCSKEAAACQAAYQTLAAMFPGNASTYNQELSNRLGLISNNSAKTEGVAVGLAAGNDIVAMRANDGSTLTANPYTGGTAPGQWRPTPAAFAPGLLPRWREVTPFGLTAASQFRRSGPPLLTSQQYTDAYNEVKSLGAANSATRTLDQTNIALFWADGGGTSTPPGHWLRIAQTVGANANLSIDDSARMFALLGMTEADAGIACWDMKYEYSFWRPVTAIREGDADTNDQTLGDATWSPLIATPPFPTFTSGHSTFSGGAATVLGHVLGSDDIAFTTTSEGANVDPRSFTSFSQAADEAAMSRLYGGIHFRFDNQVGLEMGQDIGNWEYRNYLTPVPEPGAFLALGAGLLFLRRRIKR